MMVSAFTRASVVLLILAVVIDSVEAHGFMSQPRTRGALRTQRKIVPQVMDAAAPIDYCPHCQNCGGVSSTKAAGPWKMYKPFEYKRAGITMCGDPVGKDDHTSKGQYANPPSMPFAATYKPGSIANFEYAFPTNHNGFISFYLCDVSDSPDKDIVNDPKFFKDSCHELERSPHPSCESGNDKTCGPIDSTYPGRFVVPCRDSGASDQVVGGPNGKMAYKIPDKEIKHGVIQAYWLTQNTCNSPDGFMDKYKYPSVWAGCPCDGGATGAHPKHDSCVVTGQTPEEFFSCADVRVSSSGSSGPDSNSSAGSDTSTAAADTTTASPTSESSGSNTTSPTTASSGSSGPDSNSSAGSDTSTAAADTTTASPTSESSGSNTTSPTTASSGSSGPGSNSSDGSDTSTAAADTTTASPTSESSGGSSSTTSPTTASYTAEMTSTPSGGKKHVMNQKLKSTVMQSSSTGRTGCKVVH